MPIQFACPQCHKSITVDDKLAGKSGKCKCGATLKIPQSSPPAAAPSQSASKPPTSSLGAVFDELTEADFKHESPFQNAFAPPKSTHAADNKRLANTQAKPSGSGKKSGVNNLKKFKLWQWGLIVIFASILSNVILMAIQGPMENTAASRGQAVGRGVAALVGILIGITLIIIHFVRRKPAK